MKALISGQTSFDARQNEQLKGRLLKDNTGKEYRRVTCQTRNYTCRLLSYLLDQSWIVELLVLVCVARRINKYQPSDVASNNFKAYKGPG